MDIGKNVDQFLDLIPDPLGSLEQYYRSHHLDIPQLNDDKLIDEYSYLHTHLWGLPPDHWLRQRVKMLERELGKRRGKKWQ